MEERSFFSHLCVTHVRSHVDMLVERNGFVDLSSKEAIVLKPKHEGWGVRKNRIELDGGCGLE